jgi:hypothetical protein
MAQITGQGLSIVGTQVYRHPPRYLAGHGTLLGFFVLGMAATVGNWLYMRRENKKRNERQVVEVSGLGSEEKEGMGEEELLDWHPGFRYIL